MIHLAATLLVLVNQGSGGADLPMPPPPAIPTRAPRAPKVLRVAVLDVQSQGDVPARALAVLREAIAPELRKLDGVSAIGFGEIKDVLSMERQKQVLGCTDDSSTCLMELAGAMDAAEMVTTQLTLVGDSYNIVSRRMDTQRVKALQTYVRNVKKGDGEELLAQVGPMVQALYPEIPLKPGKVRGIEASVARKLNPPPVPRWAFFTTAGVSAATLAGGVVFGLLSNEAAAQYQARLAGSANNPIPAEEVTSMQAAAKSRAQTANILFIAGGALAAVTAVEGLFTDWNDDRASLHLGPVVGPGGAGAVLSGRF